MTVNSMPPIAAARRIAGDQPGMVDFRRVRLRVINEALGSRKEIDLGWVRPYSAGIAIDHEGVPFDLDIAQWLARHALLELNHMTIAGTC